jgi:RNA polymerase sigma-70 factor (ECF subfamily)
MDKVQEQRFDALYRAAHADVLGFVARRIAADDPLPRAEDVTHEVFLTAWRRFSSVPADLSEARAWLFTAARNCLLNERRSVRRREGLTVRITADFPNFPDVAVPGPETGVPIKMDMRAAWATLTPAEQEIISLLVFEELSALQAAKLLGISVTAFRSRAFRARNKLRLALSEIPLRSPAPFDGIGDLGRANKTPPDKISADKPAHPARDFRLLTSSI